MDFIIRGQNNTEEGIPIDIRGKNLLCIPQLQRERERESESNAVKLEGKREGELFS